MCVREKERVLPVWMNPSPARKQVYSSNCAALSHTPACIPSACLKPTVPAVWMFLFSISDFRSCRLLSLFPSAFLSLSAFLSVCFMLPLCSKVTSFSSLLRTFCHVSFATQWTVKFRLLPHSAGAGPSPCSPVRLRRGFCGGKREGGKNSKRYEGQLY